MSLLLCNARSMRHVSRVSFNLHAHWAIMQHTEDIDVVNRQYVYIRDEQSCFCFGCDYFVRDVAKMGDMSSAISSRSRQTMSGVLSRVSASGMFSRPTVSILRVGLASSVGRRKKSVTFADEVMRKVVKTKGLSPSTTRRDAKGKRKKKCGKCERKGRKRKGGRMSEKVDRRAREMRVAENGVTKKKRRNRGGGTRTKSGKQKRNEYERRERRKQLNRLKKLKVEGKCARIRRMCAKWIKLDDDEIFRGVDARTLWKCYVICARLGRDNIGNDGRLRRKMVEEEREIRRLETELGKKSGRGRRRRLVEVFVERQLGVYGRMSRGELMRNMVVAVGRRVDEIGYGDEN